MKRAVKFGHNTRGDDYLDRFTPATDSDSNIIDLRYESDITISGEDGEVVIKSDNGDGVSSIGWTSITSWSVKRMIPTC